MAKKIKVSINVTTYYDPEYPDDTAASERALFMDMGLHWEDFFSREDVVFEDVEEDQDSKD